MSINIHVSCVYMPLQSYGLVQLLKFAKRRQGNDIVERKKKNLFPITYHRFVTGPPHVLSRPAKSCWASPADALICPWHTRHLCLLWSWKSLTRKHCLLAHKVRVTTRDAPIYQLVIDIGWYRCAWRESAYRQIKFHRWNDTRAPVWWMKVTCVALQRRINKLEKLITLANH